MIVSIFSFETIVCLFINKNVDNDNYCNCLLEIMSSLAKCLQGR